VLFQLPVGNVLVLPHHHDRLTLPSRVDHKIARRFLRTAVQLLYLVFIRILFGQYGVEGDRQVPRSSSWVRELEGMEGYREEGCRLLPRRKQRICGISAEIIGGKRVRSFLPYVAELPLIAVPQRMEET
jgi:hypothetical protein